MLDPHHGGEFIGDPRFGIVRYQNLLNPKFNIPRVLEYSIGNSDHHYFRWHDALVGDREVIKSYRDCVDFKLRKTDIEHIPTEFSLTRDCYEYVHDALQYCLQHYQSLYGIRLEYMEAINFVRYGEGQHFNVHSDHGFSYSCVTSSVMWLNDGYKGGDLVFPHLQMRITPRAGDAIFFPSTYIYAHASEPITEGIKYSAVTMFDYNDRNHGSDMPTSSWGHLYLAGEKPESQEKWKWGNHQPIGDSA